MSDPQRTIVRTLLASGLGLALVVASGLASADPGSVVLADGSVLAGDIQQIVKGEYLIIRLPSGEVRAIAWAQIGSFNFGGSISVGGAPAPAPTPPPPPVYQPQPTPPPVVYAPPPPPPSYQPVAPPPAPPRRFEPAATLGVRLGSITPGGNFSGSDTAIVSDPMSAYAGSGWAIEGDLGYHFSPSWTAYGFWEHAQLGRGERYQNSPTNPKANMLGFGLNANTNPDGPVGFLFDIAVGWRWMSFQQPVASANGAGWDDLVASGPVPIRLGFGLSIVPTRKFRIDLLVQASGGIFNRVNGGPACPSGCSIDGERQGTHTFSGLVAAARWDL
jgi:hypothetical protein